MKPQQMKIDHLRANYQKGTLEIEKCPPDPFLLFKDWMQTAMNEKIKEPNAFVLSTLGKDQIPNSRVVLLKKIDSGFVWYTNFESTKGRELLLNPVAAINFNWMDLERQIRIRGRVEKVASEMATVYFQSRPKGSQVGAWASPQSQIIANRDGLEEKVAKLNENFATADKLPKPEHWGGFRLIPFEMEFWQGRTSRLHDRIQYIKKNETWEKARLAP